MPRLLILSSDTGEGHNSAAEAIKEAARTTDWDVSIRKPLEESTALNRSLGHLYNLLLTHRPGSVQTFMHAINRLRPNERDICYRRVQGFVRHFLMSEAPDIILSVHPMLNHHIQRWISEQHLEIPCYTLVTDPFPPFWNGWSSRYVDHYFVATHAAHDALLQRGIASQKMTLVRMPVRSGFQPKHPSEVAQIRSRLNIDGAAIVVNGGARGGGPIEPMVRTIFEAAPATTVLVMCGHNTRVRHRLEQIHNDRLRTFGFLEETHTLIGAADLMITKPGALTTYEGLALNAPTVLSAIGGLMPQESGLFEAARRDGFAFTVTTLDELRDIAKRGVEEWRLTREKMRAFCDVGTFPSLLEAIGPSCAANIRRHRHQHGRLSLPPV